MKNNANSVLEKVLERIKPSKEELKEIDDSVREFIGKIEKNKKRFKVHADVFVGGSSAKGTLIKKENYDIDIFVRFEKKHEKENFSDLTEKLLSGIKKERIHGSRDYFKIEVGKGVFFEVVPVKKIRNNKESENVTDLSYFHVNYIKKKLKGKTLDEVRLAKAFCHATSCYGAESYIRGFSGYAIELLINHYGSFMKFVKAMKEVKPGEKFIIDTEKLHKNKNAILMDLNSAKLTSPIILIDPTHKQRNALAALSEETFRKFQNACRSFLKNPTEEAFNEKNVDFESMEKMARKKGYDFVLLEAKTGRQEGDIAGSKLLKFYNHLTKETSKSFEIKKQGFEYKGKKTAKLAFVGKARKGIIARGPEIKDAKNVKQFKMHHKKTFIKGNRIYSKENINLGLKDFITRWKNSNTDRIKEMFILDLKIV